MDGKKEATEATRELPPSPSISSDELQIEGHTKNDQIDMLRLGRKQQMKRGFRQFSIIALTTLAMGTWMVLFVANTQALTNGGLAGLFWSYIWSMAGMSCIIASMSEMASMAPTVGGQYHWVSEFSPPKYQKLFSYMTGWMSCLSWQASNAAGPFLCGGIIQGLVIVNYPDYEATRWQATLIMFGIVAMVYINNVYFMRWLPVLTSFTLYLYVAIWIALTGLLFARAPPDSATRVFTEFTNLAGWDSMGLALMVGQISALWSLICSDAAVHMGEETSEASIAVPRAMWWSYVLNAALALVFLIAMLFALPSVEDAVNDPSGYPMLYILQRALPDHPAAVNAIVALLLVIWQAGNLSFNAVTSRQTFAFARDRGLPCSRWLGHIDPARRVPANAIAATCAIACLLALINVGSAAAFAAIVSLNLVAILSTYLLAIGCLVHRRLTAPHSLRAPRWSLGRAGLPINLAALVYGAFAFFWSFWPAVAAPGVQEFNWSVVIFVGVFVFAVGMYVAEARHTYKGPVTLIRQDVNGLDMYEGHVINEA